MAAFEIILSPMITHYCLLGERCSGTNLLEDILMQMASIQPAYPLGFKHFPKPFEEKSVRALGEMPMILVVRHPESWIRSLYSKPWHVAPEIKRLNLQNFIRAPWWSLYDEDANVHPGDERYHKAIEGDLDWTSGSKFANVARMRSQKMRDCIRFHQVASASVIVRLEDLVRNPWETANRSLQRIGLPPSDIKPSLSGYKGRRSWQRRIAEMAGLGRLLPAAEQKRPCPQLGADDIDYLWRELDAEIERSLGYARDGAVVACHL